MNTYRIRLYAKGRGIVDDAISGFSYLREKHDQLTLRVNFLEEENKHTQAFLSEIKTHFKWVKFLGSATLLTLVTQTIMQIFGGA